MKAYLFRFGRLLFGVLLCSLGVYMTIQANVGLAPWDAFAVGLTNYTGLTIGRASIVVFVLSTAGAMTLGEKIGLGTLCSAFLVGLLLDLFYWLNLISPMTGYLYGVPLLLAGMLTICVGSFFYIGAALGCGPRDALAIGFTKKRWNRLPLGVTRICVDSVVLLIGAMLGAKVGVGTLIMVLGYGFCLQLVFRLLHFDAKKVEHESLLVSCRYLGRYLKN